MKTRPKALSILAASVMSIAISLPLQIMFLYDHTPFELQAIFAKLAPLNWMILALAPITAWLLLKASFWLVLTAPLFAVLILYNNWFVAEIGTSYSPISIGFATGMFLIGFSSLLSKGIREIILNPQRRWWLTPKRHRAKLPVKMKLLTERGLREVELSTFDISEGGAFLISPQPEDKEIIHQNQVAVGMRCYLQLVLHSDSNPLSCRAEVIRMAGPRGDYPPGIGIRFLGMGWRERQALKKLLMQTQNVPMRHAS
jgi:hypothetical protein